MPYIQMIAAIAWPSKKKKRKGYNSLYFFKFPPEIKEKKQPLFDLHQMCVAVEGLGFRVDLGCRIVDERLGFKIECGCSRTEKI